jgi:hypothetical protein
MIYPSPFLLDRAAGLYFDKEPASSDFVNNNHLNALTGANKKYRNDTLTAFATGLGRKNSISFHYCGMPRLCFWKSSLKTLCLSCLPNFNVGKTQGSQMTSMANIMGYGLWFESGAPKVGKFWNTNSAGPMVSIVDDTTTTQTACSMTVGYTEASYLYWPTTVFAQISQPASNSDGSYSILGVTNAYTITDNSLNLVTDPDSTSSYVYATIEVISSGDFAATNPRSDSNSSIQVLQHFPLLSILTLE